jgi:hypothetical protein
MFEPSVEIDYIQVDQIAVGLEADGSVVVVVSSIGNVSYKDLTVEGKDIVTGNNTAHPITTLGKISASFFSKLNAIVSGVQSASNSVVSDVYVASSCNSSFGIRVNAGKVFQGEHVEERRNSSKELILSFAGNSFGGRRNGLGGLRLRRFGGWVALVYGTLRLSVRSA